MHTRSKDKKAAEAAKSEKDKTSVSVSKPSSTTPVCAVPAAKAAPKAAPPKVNVAAKPRANLKKKPATASKASLKEAAKSDISTSKTDATSENPAVVNTPVLPAPVQTTETMSDDVAPSIQIPPQPAEFLPSDQTMPSYATSSATKCLQKQLRQVIKTQLGSQLGNERFWTLDLGRLDNLYIWYFTLGCFDPDIPLAQDMKNFGMKDIQLQVLFGPQHPHTPPFVRVIKPRFRQWMNGGGGHITGKFQRFL